MKSVLFLASLVVASAVNGAFYGTNKCDQTPLAPATTIGEFDPCR